jgi:hypothetical protein
MRKFSVLCAAVATTASLFLSVVPAVAEPPTTAPAVATDLPTAEAVLAKYVAATGGQAAYDSIKSRAAEATMTLKEMGLNATISIRQKPGKAIIVTNIPGIGESKVGMVDKVIWANDQMQGPRLITGAEADSMIAQLDLSEKIDFSRYESSKIVGIENVGGSDAYKMEMVNKSGQPETRFYDVASGLLVKQINIAASPMGELQVESIMSDYQDTKPIKTAMKTVQKMQGMTPEMSTTKIEHNVEIDDAIFAVPAEVQALIDKQRAEQKP